MNELEETKIEQAEQKNEPRSLSTIEANDAGYLSSKTLDGRWRLASAFYKAGMVPKSYKSPEQVMVGMEYAIEIGLKPLSGLRNIAVINSTPSLWGDLPLALVRRLGAMEWIEEFLFDEQYQKISFENKNLGTRAWGALCRTKRKDSAIVRETHFTMDMAKDAGLLGRDNVWKSYPHRMLQMRARSQNLKDNFPEALASLDIAEYDFNYIPDDEARDVSRSGEIIRDPAKELNGVIQG